MTVLYLDRRAGLGLALALAAGLTLGLIIGFFAGKGGGNSRVASSSHSDRFPDSLWVSAVLDRVSSKELRENLRNLTAAPHIAAGPRDRQLVAWIREKWTAAGLLVHNSPFKVLLSYPDPTRPNKIFLLDSNGTVRFTSKHQEKVLRPEDAHDNFIDAFNAFAPAGEVEGELVYVNYGRVEDLKQLKELGVSINGSIALARYGKVFRGNKLANCEAEGAKGLILFSDPAEVARLGTDPGSVYPNTFFLPPSGIQRGSVKLGARDGDPLSPGWPSVPGAYRPPVQKSAGLPGIPAQPVGYGDAARLLEVMGGPAAPAEWAGGLNLTYKLGPGWAAGNQNWRVRLLVHNRLEDRDDDNLVGLVRGALEPDRVVVVGNHRDAWGWGAVDPSSGTSPLLEVGRVLGELQAAGWRPRRSILLASWGSEESGLMGSTEWVEDRLHGLAARQTQPSLHTLQRVILLALKTL